MAGKRCNSEAEYGPGGAFEGLTITASSICITCMEKWHLAPDGRVTATIGDAAPTEHMLSEEAMTEFRAVLEGTALRRERVTRIA